MSWKTVTFAVVSQRAQVLPELREQLALLQDSNASQHFSVAMMPGSFSVRFPPDARHTGVANSEALEAVESTTGSSSINFLSNALKFTPSGGAINIVLHVGDGAVRIDVSDTGPGIAPTNHEKIFEKFTQLDSTETRQHSGTGLGLTISRDLARLLHGRIELDSGVGSGAAFSLIIPLLLEQKSVPLMPHVAEHSKDVELT